MIKTFVRALLAVVILAALTALVYPLAMTGIGQLAFNAKADGSLVEADGRPVGSSLIGQQWKGPRWFYGRPSVIDYDASTSSGSNLGPRSNPLADEIRTRARAIITLEGPYHLGLTTADIPVDLLTTSSSGLDPNITPEAPGSRRRGSRRRAACPLIRCWSWSTSTPRGARWGSSASRASTSSSSTLRSSSVRHEGRRGAPGGRRDRQERGASPLIPTTADRDVLVLALGPRIAPEQQRAVEAAVADAFERRVPLEARIASVDEVTHVLADVSDDDMIRLLGLTRRDRRALGVHR